MNTHDGEEKNKEYGIMPRSQECVSRRMGSTWSDAGKQGKSENEELVTGITLTVSVELWC